MPLIAPSACSSRTSAAGWAAVSAMLSLRSSVSFSGVWHGGSARLDRLHQLEKNASRAPRMNERHEPVRTGPRYGIDELDPLICQTGQLVHNILDLHGDVMERLALPLEKPPNAR